MKRKKTIGTLKRGDVIYKVIDGFIREMNVDKAFRMKYRSCDLPDVEKEKIVIFCDPWGFLTFDINEKDSTSVKDIFIKPEQAIRALQARFDDELLKLQRETAARRDSQERTITYFRDSFINNRKN